MQLANFGAIVFSQKQTLKLIKLYTYICVV